MDRVKYRSFPNPRLSVVHPWSIILVAAQSRYVSANGPRREIHVLRAQPPPLKQPHSRSVEQTRNERVRPSQVLQPPMHFLPAQILRASAALVWPARIPPAIPP